ncbi:MAG: hypothetical protein KDA24_02790 [Deltaproteobacteria bacterium]|nr:hypothetical protein [Deltaproteobacteria bacterium]
MPDVPRGAPLVDLLVPIGTSKALPDVQTRLELAGGAGWRLLADDGAMETSMIPSMPLRGSLERVWAVRSMPMMQGEPLQEAVGIGMEVAITTQAHLAAVGIYGVIGWGVVLFDEPKWLYGLTLLEWLYNPRLAADGTIVEGEPDAAAAEANLRAKVRLYPRLFTPEAVSRFVSRVPPGAIQDVEGMQALTLLGPGGTFDPRYWQSFSVQMALAEVQALSQAAAPKNLAENQPAPAPPPPPGPPAPPSPPDDGLTPLQRARRDAERKAAEAAANPEPEVVVPEPEVVADGEAVRWIDGERPVLVIPGGRLDAALVRELQGGSLSSLARSERPAGSLFERWVHAGGHFVTEVPFLSRLFLDNAPLHGQSFKEAATADGDLLWLDCHLPRVARVRAVRVPVPEGRRIVLGSDREASASSIAGAILNVSMG